jgi:hypothetical protein
MTRTWRMGKWVEVTCTRGRVAATACLGNSIATSAWRIPSSWREVTATGFVGHSIKANGGWVCLVVVLRSLERLKD